MTSDAPNGLIYRRAQPDGNGRVVLEELWDIDVPGCPMIRNPWSPQLPGHIFIRRLIMSDREYEQSKPPLLERSRAAGQ